MRNASDMKIIILLSIQFSTSISKMGHLQLPKYFNKYKYILYLNTFFYFSTVVRQFLALTFQFVFLMQGFNAKPLLSLYSRTSGQENCTRSKILLCKLLSKAFRCRSLFLMFNIIFWHCSQNFMRKILFISSTTLT